MNSISKKIFYKLSLLLIVLSSLSYSKDALIVKTNQPGSLILELSVDSLWYSDDKKQIFTSPILDLLQEPNNPRLPYFKEVLVGIPANANIKVYKSDIWWSDKWDPRTYGRDGVLRRRDRRCGSPSIAHLPAS